MSQPRGRGGGRRNRFELRLRQMEAPHEEVRGGQSLGSRTEDRFGRLLDFKVTTRLSPDGGYDRLGG
ncbi:MAG: hypothetical protein GYA33_08925 [Thermogutta sp.]|nr:hypothetical protein [Thermogutta sp.]